MLKDLQICTGRHEKDKIFGRHRIFLKFTWKGKRNGITDIINFEKKRIKYEESVYAISQIT